jgi:hypothetical protein
LQCLPYALLLRFGRVLSRELEQPLESGVLGSGLLSDVSAAELRLPEAAGRVEEGVEFAAVSPGELVDRIGGDGRLRSAFASGCSRASAFRAAVNCSSGSP